MPGTNRATQKFYIFFIVYLTGSTPDFKSAKCYILSTDFAKNRYDRVRIWYTKLEYTISNIKEIGLGKTFTKAGETGNESGNL